MPVVKSSERAHQFVPEPFVVDIDPALAHAVVIPAAMPIVAVVTEPHAVAVPMPDNEFAATTNPIRADVRADITSLIPVSYTHLRAHETDSYLVCRLLL